MKTNSPLLIVAFMSMALVGCVSTQAMKRLEVNFQHVEQEALKLSQSEYESMADDVPDVLKDLDYDDYRKIRFNEDMTLWRNEGMPFQVQFFHLGYLFKEPVELHEFTTTHAQRVPYVKEFFDTSDFNQFKGELSSSLDYAGFKVLYPLNPDVKRYDELVTFLGASYFRALGQGMNYGLSARGLAVNCGLGTPEEFPRFVKFWLGKPIGNSDEMTVYALLDSPSVVGAFEFTVIPGESTQIDVRQTIMIREEVQSLGIAPLTSMFWFGENSAVKPSDYRPEVHDSDGLLIETIDGDVIWRPLDVGEQARHSYYKLEVPQGFGLMQRDRKFESYEDLEAKYHNRPSVWIEPKGNWGKGSVRLLELPTNSEFDDNVVALWQPERMPKKGDVLKYEYRMHWTQENSPAKRDLPYAVSTRSGYMDEERRDILYIVDFASGNAHTFDPNIVPTVDAQANGNASLVHADVIWNPKSESWRVSLRLHAEGEDPGVIELSCKLNFGDAFSSEQWNYQWTR